MALYIGLLATDAFVNPLLAQYAPETVHSAEAMEQQFRMFGIALFLQPFAVLIFTTGYTLFSLNIFHPGVVSKWVDILWLFGALLFGPATLVPVLIEQIGGVMLGLGHIGWWFALRSQT